MISEVMTVTSNGGGGGGFITYGDHWFVFWTCIECVAYINVCQFCFWFTSSSQFIFNNFKSLYLFLSLQIMQWQLRNSTTLQLLWKFVIDLFCMLKFKCLWTIFVLVYWVKWERERERERESTYIYIYF